MRSFVACDRLEKKEQGSEPCSKIVSTLNFLENLDLLLICRGDAACARQGSSRDLDHQALPLGQPEFELVDHLFLLVTIFGNVCSKFQHSAK
jgi:hypothetical protein